jgi:ribonucleoside-diphosphate reductase alpha chain
MIDFKRPEVLKGYTPQVKTPCGTFFLTLNDDGEKLREVRMCIGKSGNCQRLLFETIALLISVLLQSGIPREKIAKTISNQLDSNCGNKILYKGEEYSSCVDYSVKKIMEDMASREEIEITEEAEA